MSIRVGETGTAPRFEIAAREALFDTQLRRNVKKATGMIRNRRDAVVSEVPDWEALREAGQAIKAHTMQYLDSYLEDFEAQVSAHGGTVHWADDADEACHIIAGLIHQHGGREVIKVKTMTSDEIGLNAHLASASIAACETDLADMIIQLGEDLPSHIVVPALHKNHVQVQQIFKRKLPLASLGIDQLGDEPPQLAEAARRYLRDKFLRVQIGVSGANFAVAETGSLVVVESEGNGRMCITLPEVLICLVGIEKIVPSFRDLEVFLQLLPRSATGERMNPYTSIWTGVTPGDGPRALHVVLLDNGRTRVFADAVGRQALHCIRCAACLNACPVYERTGGQAYGSIYSGPIGAILTPQLLGLEQAQSLPYASSLCGACYEVCPVKINIPEVLVHLRGQVVRQQQRRISNLLNSENLLMCVMAKLFSSPSRLETVYRLARVGAGPFVSHGAVSKLPGLLAGWTAVRDLVPIPAQSFREWWRERSPIRAEHTADNDHYGERP